MIVKSFINPLMDGDDYLDVRALFIQFNEK